MTHRKRTKTGIVIVLAIAAVAALGAGYSLATDLGYSDEHVADVCDAGACAKLIRALDARGFPHATTAPVEVYVLETGGDVKQVLVVDWGAQDATIHPILPPGVSPTVTLTLSPPGYAHVVDLATSLRDGRPVPDASLWHGVKFWLDAPVEIHEGGPFSGVAWKIQLTNWARTIQGASE